LAVLGRIYKNRAKTGVTDSFVWLSYTRSQSRVTQYLRPDPADESNIKLNIMQRTLTSVLSLAVSFMFALGIMARAEDAKVDPTGTWKWSQTGQNGQARETTLKIKQDGDKLKGTVSGRNNTENEVEDLKLKGNEISFKVTREFQNNKFTQKFNGKIMGNTIKGKIEFERNGEAQSRDWEAKKEEAKKEAK
jgi:hypothetical protein